MDVERVRIDATEYSVVAVCDCEGCSWRALAHSRPSAQRLAAFHVRFVHDDVDTAHLLRDAAAASERRLTRSTRRRGRAGSRPRSTRPAAGPSSRRPRRRFDGDGDPAPAG